MIDGTSRWSVHYLSIILYTRNHYTYYKTKAVYSENAKIIEDIINEYIKTMHS